MSLFDITTVANLIVANEADTAVFNDDPGTVPAANNDPVHKWGPAFSTTYAATPTIATYPFLKTNRINGLPTVQSQNVVDGLLSLASFNTSLGDFTLFIVFQESASVGRGSEFLRSSDGLLFAGDSLTAGKVNANGGEDYLQHNTYAGPPDLRLSLPLNQPHIVTVRRVGSTITLHGDAGLQVVSFTGSSTAIAAGPLYYFWDHHHVEVAGYFLWSRGLTNTEVTNIEQGYLGAKYGIGPVTAGTVTVGTLGKTKVDLSSTGPTLGIPPYTSTWEYSSDSGATWTVAPGQTGNTSATIVGLLPGTAYQARQKSTDTTAFISTSNVVSFTTNAGTAATGISIAAPGTDFGPFHQASGNFTVTATPSGAVFNGATSIAFADDQGKGGYFKMAGATIAAPSYVPAADATSFTFKYTAFAATYATLSLSKPGWTTVTSTWGGVRVSGNQKIVATSSTITLILTAIGEKLLTTTPTFSLSGGTGASITAQHIDTDTQVTLTIATGSASATLTVSGFISGLTYTLSAINTYSQVGFAGTSGTNLTSYGGGGGDVGFTWVKQTGHTGNAFLDGSGGVYGGADGLYLNDSGRTTVSTQLDWYFSLSYKTAGTPDDFQLYFRAVKGADTYYAIETDFGGAHWRLKQYTAGTPTTLATITSPTFVQNQVYPCKLEIKDGFKVLYIDFGDGVFSRILATTDNTLTGTESNGNYLGFDLNSGSPSASTGWHLSAWKVRDATRIADANPGGWDMAAVQPPEIDTTLLVDIAKELAEVPAGGIGLIYGGDADYSNVVTAAGAQRLGFIPGASAGGNFYLPAEGVIAPDQWTVEFHLKCSAAWGSAGDNHLFSIGSGFSNAATFIRGELNAGTLTVVANDFTQPGAQYSLNALFTLSNALWADLGLTANSDHVFAIVRNGTKLYVLIDNVALTPNALLSSSAAIPFPSPPPALSSDWVSGFSIGGDVSATAPQMTIDSVRVSRFVRLPGVVPTLSGPSLTITPGTTLSTGINSGMRGGVGEALTPTGITRLPAIMGNGGQVRWGGKAMSCTPIKHGSPGTDPYGHSCPTLGHSGSFSYDWQRVDRSLAAASPDKTTKIYLNIGANVSILNPAATDIIDAANLTTGTTEDVEWDGSVPTDGNGTGSSTALADYATIQMDLLHRCVVTLGYTVEFVSFSNEPYQNSADWAGTQAQWNQTYKALADALLALRGSVPALANARFGGGELASIGDIPFWFGDTAGGGSVDGTHGLIKFCADNNVLLEMVAVHNYEGSSVFYEAVFRLINTLVATHSFVTTNPNGIELLAGEQNINLASGDALAVAPWNLQVGTKSARTGAYIVRQMILAHLHPQWRYSDVYSTGEAPDLQGMLDGHVDARYNAMLLEAMLPNTRLTQSSYSEFWPGVTAISSKDSGNLYVLISNYNYRNVVGLQLAFGSGLAGRVVQSHYVIDKSHSSYFEAGVSHEALETVAGATLDGSGSLTVSLGTRSVHLLKIQLSSLTVTSTTPSPVERGMPYTANVTAVNLTLTNVAGDYSPSGGSVTSIANGSPNDAQHKIISGIGPTGVGTFAITTQGIPSGSITVSDTTAPAAPSNLTAVITNANVSVTWTDPASTGDGPYTYDLHRSANSGTTWSTLVSNAAGSTYADNASLIPGNYLYRVRAYDAAGNLKATWVQSQLVFSSSGGSGGGSGGGSIGLGL